MAEEPRTAIQLLGTAALLGLIGVFLFNDAAWGINIFFWVLALGFGAVSLSQWLGKPIPKLVKLATPGVLIFAGCFAFRESPELKIANGVGLFLLIGALLVRTNRGSLSQSSLYELTLKAVGAWFKLSADFARLVVEDVKWKADDKVKGRMRSIFGGVVIATPLLILFGALFVSADDAFRAIVSNAFSFDWLDGDSLIRIAVIFAFCIVLAAGSYRIMFMEQKAVSTTPTVQKAEPFTSLGITEIAVVFVLLNALFGLFCVVQASYLFGGLHHLKAVGPLTNSEYARHGFFELTLVSACALATILGFHSLLRDPCRHQRSFGLLGGTLAVLVAVVLASAFQRMNLYIDFAGLTELRLYTTSFMVWIATVLIWLAATVLRGQRSRFAMGALVSGLFTIFVLNVINPDATIARYNLDRPQLKVDLDYLKSLSVDAAPAIVASTDRLSPKDSAAIKQGPRTRWSKEVDTDWRGINFARWKFLTFYPAEL